MKRGDFRVCQLAGCDVWRVEKFEVPRWWAFWQKPSWRGVLLWSISFDGYGGSHSAEYRSRVAAEAGMERFQKQERESAARSRSAWQCGAALILALGCASPALARPSKTLIAWTSAWGLCQAFDTVSTYVALRNPALREANPLMRGPHIYVVKIGVNLGLGVTQEPDSKKKFIVPVMMAISGCLAGGLNVRTIRSTQ